MITNPAEVLPKVTGQNTFFFKKNDLGKGWYVIFVQIILACENARKKRKFVYCRTYEQQPSHRIFKN
jgi:hypothetical protein